MFKNVSKWLGVVDNTTDEETLEVNAEGEEKVVEKPPEEDKQEKSDEVKKDETTNDDLISPETKQALEDASAKAITTAKEWGSYLYTFGKQATEKVTEQAKMISKKVEDGTFLGEFSKENDKFVNEKQEKEKKSEAAVPPWVGYNEEEAMKSQILALSQDKRNFLRNPPTGIQFQFEFDSVFPVAMATLQEDPNLQKMRFELVPKQINEETFWRNYFYRVSLIKQSTQLTSLAQQTANCKDPDERAAIGALSSGSFCLQNIKSREQQVKEKTPQKEDQEIKPVNKEEEEIVTVSPGDNEFVSDAFQDQISEEDLKKEMEMLGVEDKDNLEAASDDAIPQWEKELQQDLQDYELVNEGDDLDDADIENEILKQIEQESSNP